MTLAALLLILCIALWVHNDFKDDDKCGLTGKKSEDKRCKNCPHYGE